MEEGWLPSDPWKVSSMDPAGLCFCFVHFPTSVSRENREEGRETPKSCGITEVHFITFG